MASEEKKLNCLVGIGGSAGALEAYEAFLKGLPPEIHGAFIIVQHMDPQQKSHLPELLSKYSHYRVKVAENGDRILPDHIYLNGPGMILGVEGQVITTRKIQGHNERINPIDHFFASVARSFGTHAIGIILSGTGKDGTEGLRFIRQAGGRTLVQDPDEARFNGMPQSAIDAKVAERVIPAKLMGKTISFFLECGPKSLHEFEDPSLLNLICEALYRKTGHDFSSYKKSTIGRRIDRRVQANSCRSLPEYLDFLERDKNEANALLQDLLISVTQFFRDPEAFEALQKKVIPELINNLGAEDILRIWVPACATGEEAYTIAILVKEYERLNGRMNHIQIFATDIDRIALDFARNGLYPDSIRDNVDPLYLERYFKKTENGYQATKELRECCIFSEHSLLKNPAFSRIDFISCRNLFIYWEPELQNKVIPIFHYSLSPSGFLFLGPAENISSNMDLFKVIDKKNRIFQRNEAVKRNHLDVPINFPRPRSVETKAEFAKVQMYSEKDLSKRIASSLLEDFAPPAFVVNEQADIVFYSGRTGKFMEPTIGAPSNLIYDVIRKAIRPEIHALLHKCIKTKCEVSNPAITFENEGAIQKIKVVVRPLNDIPNSKLYLIVFNEEVAPLSKEDALKDGITLTTSNSLVEQLEEELRDTREHLQSTIEEVRSSNEELLSMNEELQSANEELQTSKEELQSTNEELETVNSELSKKVEELDTSNSDLQNFFNSAHIPILFLDRKFRIQKFTPAATSIFRLIASDIGRHISDITSKLEVSDFSECFKEVLESLRPIDREISTQNKEHHYIMRINPYRTINNVIDGLTVSFSDVTDLKRAQASKSILAAIVEYSSDAIMTRDLEGKVTSWNKGAERLYLYKASEAVGKPITLIIPNDRLNEFKTLEKNVLNGEIVQGIDTERIKKNGERIAVSKTMSPILDSNGKHLGLSIIYRDISERKRNEEVLGAFASLVEYSSDAIISRDLKGNITSWNKGAERIYQYSQDEAVGRPITLIIPKDKIDEFRTLESKVLNGEIVQGIDTERVRKDGQRIPVSKTMSPIWDKDGKNIGMSVIYRDISERRRNEEALKKSHDDLKLAVRARDEFLSVASHELKTPLTSLKIQVQLRKRKVLNNDEAVLQKENILKTIENDERQIKRLTRLIDDMLDITRINTGKLTVNPEHVDLSGLVYEVSDRLSEQLADADCELQIEAKANVFGRWDRFRIEQVYTNLLTNAMKYGAGKPIKVTVSKNDKMALLTVQDLGIGIDQADQKRIFMQFERAVKSGEVSGLGLGLYIVAQIMNAHGGNIHVESELGQGSKFVAQLPLA